ncbi:hypothetical protein OAL58_03630 [Verrucomicrobia bacterium]|nr:hypothetical protein [Verrucomicrobiota bacterium]
MQSWAAQESLVPGTGEDSLLAALGALVYFAPLPLAVVMLVKGAFREINMGEGLKKLKKNAPSLFTKPSTMPTMEMQNDEIFYEQVAAELEEGIRKKGLWLKAETKAEGDADKARAIYARWRVEQLSSEEAQQQKEREFADIKEKREALRHFRQQKEREFADIKEKREVIFQKLAGEARLQREKEAEEQRVEYRDCCPKCGFLMVEIAKAAWKCKRCNPD